MSKKAVETPAALAAIETLAQGHSRDREYLSGAVAALEAELATAKRRALPAIRRLVAKAKASHLELHQAVDSNRELFARPRSRILHGIKVGLKKGAGKVTFEDSDKVVQLIEKHFPEQAELLIATEKKPVKAALANLDAKDLKRIGCEISGTGDVVLVQAADSEVDKVVNALLDGHPEENEE